MLRRFLPSVVEHSVHDLIVVDNGSDDGSLTFLRSHYPAVRIIQLASNVGYSGGYNEGLAQLQGSYEFYLLLNSDMSVTPAWDLKMVDFLVEHPKMAVAQPKIRSINQEGYFDYAGGAGGFLDSFGYPYCRGRILHTLEEDRGQYQESINLDWASGACFCVRASCFHGFGGFDPMFFAHMEEIDLCWRLRSAGWEIGVNPEVAVFHLGGGTLRKSNPRKTYLNFRNSLFMLYKNLSCIAFIRVFVMRMVLDFGALIHIAFSNGLQHAWAIHKAYVHFLKNYRKLPTSPRNPAKFISSKQAHVKSIILAYYLQRKTRFGDFD
ncbi:Glycosyltransferase [Lunatimonas lonarensis]|uniref:Glycosyltransferase n=2 Tax=Lunatimonas lonarensis TaxID=1232681 RepID=R7ZWN4_9BACT|nr:Glycosyltransferase [Lunatimonas lonarensis]